MVSVPGAYEDLQVRLLDLGQGLGDGGALHLGTHHDNFFQHGIVFGRLFLVSLSQRVRRKQRRLDSEGELNHVAFFHLDCSFVIPDCRGFSTGTPHARTGWNQPITVSISSSD